MCFRDRKADKFLSFQHFGNNPGLEFFAAKVENRGQPDDLPSQKTYKCEQNWRLSLKGQRTVSIASKR
jgi:hypothetical protein